MIRTFTALGIVAVVVSGCSGGTSAKDAAFNIPAFSEAADVLAANAAAVDRINDLAPTGDGSVPLAGTATFAGPILINDISGSDSSASLSGGMEVVVDFGDANEITGAAGNFFDEDGDAVDGTLTLAESQSFQLGDESGFQSDLTGRLGAVGSDGEVNEFDYDITLAQTYGGDGVSALSGIGAGTATAVGTDNAQALDVTSVAEKR